MTNIKLRWLWVVVGVEVAAIVGLVVWAQTFRQEPEPLPQPVVQAPRPKAEPKPKVVYKKPKIALVKIIGGLEQPVIITARPDATDKRLFVGQLDGKIFIVGENKKLEAKPFLNIDGRILSGGEMGLLGLAFHPKVAENGYFYVSYIDNNKNAVFSRFSISAQTGLADAGSEKILLKFKDPYTNHNGGNLAFGPDGYLYISIGDGGSRGDPGNRAQNKNEFFGKMLRINVDSGDPYSVPADNPFANGGGKPEIWALGLRNPWRFSFDSKTGDIYIADVGQGEYEEINYQPRASKGGENYGWRCYEGQHKYNTDGCPAASTFVPPIIEYNHDDGRCSVTGGFVYRGQKFPALEGKYFYGDYCNGHIYYAEHASGSWKVTSAIDSEHKLSTFSVSSTGELYVTDYATGEIYQLTDTAN